MKKKPQKKDSNQIAKSIVDIVTGEKPKPKKKLPAKHYKQ